jgi:hypothetical protein
MMSRFSYKERSLSARLTILMREQRGYNMLKVMNYKTMADRDRCELSGAILL